jgi:hypothetical protein
MSETIFEHCLSSEGRAGTECVPSSGPSVLLCDEASEHGAGESSSLQASNELALWISHVLKYKELVSTVLCPEYQFEAFPNPNMHHVLTPTSQVQ